MSEANYAFVFRRLVQVPSAARVFLAEMRDQHGAEYAHDVDAMDDATVIRTASELIDLIMTESNEGEVK